MDILGVKPTDFLHLFETIQDSQTEWNEHCKKCDLLFQEEEKND